MLCPNCRTELKLDALSCPTCGLSIDANVNNREIAQENKEKQKPKNASDKTKYATLDREKSLFVEENLHYYARKWERIDKGGLTFNFVAFFFSIGWLGYRKMYVPVVMIGLLFLMNDILYIFFELNNIIALIDKYIGMGVNVIVGMFGNDIYKWHTEKKVQAIKEKATSPAEKVTLLTKKGGTSLLGILKALLILIAVYIVPLYLILLWIEMN